MLRMPEFEPDPKAVFVNSVCSALIDSRFGPGRSRPIVIRLSQWPELEPEVFYEMGAGGPFPALTILSDSEFARRFAEDLVRRESTPPRPYNAILHIRPDRTTDPANHGRGSP